MDAGTSSLPMPGGDENSARDSLAFRGPDSANGPVLETACRPAVVRDTPRPHSTIKSIIRQCLPVCPFTMRRHAVRSLPDDALYIIFGHVVASEVACEDWARPFTTNLVLSSVSRSWRLVALDTPGLWQFIFVDAARLATVVELEGQLTRVQSFLNFSKGRVHRLCISNFPGALFNLPGGEKVWIKMIRALVPVCERFYLVTAENEGSIMSSLPRVFDILASCDTPCLSQATITIGELHTPPSIRYQLAVPLFSTAAPLLRALTISGISLRQPTWSVCNACHLTSIEFCTGSFTGDILPLVAAHRSTLKRLALSHVYIDGAGLPMRSLPSLSILELAGESTALLTRFSDTKTPKLMTIRIEFKGALSARHLDTFLNLRPNKRLSSLILYRKQSDFLHYIPCILRIKHLRSLSLHGQIEPAFFERLTGRLPYCSSLAELDTLRISYDHHLNDIADGLVTFLNSLARRGHGTLRNFSLEPIGRHAPRVPLPFRTLVLVSVGVERCVIGGTLCTDIIGDLSYWVSFPVLYFGCLLVSISLCTVCTLLWSWTTSVGLLLLANVL